MSYEGEACGTFMEPYSTEPVTLIEEVFPQDTNAYDTLFGGRLLSLMDKAGGIACAKFAHREFVTISIDTLTFIAPARQGDLLEVTGRVVFTSSHTACTKVTAYTMSKATWEKSIICEGYFFFVAIDSMMRPIRPRGLSRSPLGFCPPQTGGQRWHERRPPPRAFVSGTAKR